MGRARAKTFDYAVDVDDSGIAVSGSPPLALPAEWTADHLLLAALVRCSIESFAYHARRAGHTVQGRGSAAGRVTRRETDGRYAFVSIDCVIRVSISPPLGDALELSEKAERDCFVGATLTIKPRYEWRLRVEGG